MRALRPFLALLALGLAGERALAQNLTARVGVLVATNGSECLIGWELLAGAVEHARRLNPLLAPTGIQVRSAPPACAPVLPSRPGTQAGVFSDVSRRPASAGGVARARGPRARRLVDRWPPVCRLSGRVFGAASARSGPALLSPPRAGAW